MEKQQLEATYNISISTLAYNSLSSSIPKVSMEKNFKKQYMCKGGHQQ